MIDELYDFIGGNHRIGTDAFYRRVLADDTLRAFSESTDSAQLREGQCMLSP